MTKQSVNRAREQVVVMRGGEVCAGVFQGVLRDVETSSMKILEGVKRDRGGGAKNTCGGDE